MASFSREDQLREAVFTGVDLRGARFVESDLSDVVMRGVEVARADIDAPWLVHGGSLLVNGVNVIGYVEAELDKRFPGRELRRASDPDGLRAAWSAVEQSWAAILDRVASMPAGAVDTSVAGEWSFAQTLRHLIFATDLWLGKGALQLDDPIHPMGRLDDESTTPAYADVLQVRAERVAMVRDFLAALTAQELLEPRQNPHEPEFPETTLSCLHVILEEEWEHLRFATRDLDTISS